MRIVSTFLPSEHTPEAGDQATIVMVFDTLVDQVSVVVGITVGQVQGNDLNAVRVSSVGQVVIARLGAHRQRNYPNGVVVVAGVAQVASAKKRVRDVLAKAPQGAAVLLVCADDKVYDAAFDALGVDMQSANMRPQ